MSQGIRPPSSPYGDQDFIADSPPVGLPPPSPPNQNTGIYGNLNQPLSNMPPMQNPYPVISDANDLRKLNSALTQEDLLFMRSYRQDTFYGKSLPIFVIGCGALYLYRRSKGLPHKVFQYVGVGVLANIIGPYLNRGELIRRLEKDPSNTLFKESLRKFLGVTRPYSEMQTDVDGSQFGNLPDNELTDWSLPEQRFAQDYRAPIYGNPNLPNLDPPGGQNSDNPVRPVSYEELRARNRGYIK